MISKKAPEKSHAGKIFYSEQNITEKQQFIFPPDHADPISVSGRKSK
jgi:hypothetical protein